MYGLKSTGQVVCDCLLSVLCLIVLIGQYRVTCDFFALYVVVYSTASFSGGKFKIDGK